MEQSQSLDRVTRTKLLKGQTARKTLYVLNKIWLLLETSRNIFLITLRNCKHHTGALDQVDNRQPTERHLPREQREVRVAVPDAGSKLHNLLSLI